ncbi:MAG: hypothetical protein NTV80_15225 [Verrucomicrobia bacterium]|nr:hypothetical protein [Verrucomicrobiota bacterium]
MKKAPIYALLASACLISMTLAKWTRIPAAETRTVNMSLGYVGTTVDSSTGISPSSGLITGDVIKPINVAAGKSEAVIKFAKQSMLKTASFVSDGLEGKVDASVSSDGKAWNQIASSVFSTSDREIKLNAGAAQGRYLRLQFELIHGGSIRSFQVFGSLTSEEADAIEVGEDSPVNYASAFGGGRLIYMSPESYGSRNEAASGGSIDFPESNDKYRTAVYDLGQVRTLTEFGSVHSPRPVRMTVYAFDVLPEKEDWRGRLTFDPTIFDTTQPVASGEDPQGAGVVEMNPDQAVKARYLALRWEPDFNPPGMSIFSLKLNGKGKAKGGNKNTRGANGLGDKGANSQSPGGLTTPFSGAPSGSGVGVGAAAASKKNKSPK